MKKWISRIILLSGILTFGVSFVFCNGSTISSSNLPPFFVIHPAGTVFAFDDYARINENEPAYIPVLNNDNGLLEGVGSLAVMLQPAHGTAIVQTNHTILYTPDDSYAGPDQFTYKVCNISGDCDEATVDIDVENVDFKPEARNDTATFVHGADLVIDILENDKMDGDRPIDVLLLTQLNNGYAALTEDYMLVPEFERKFIGTDSLDYQICDTDGDCSTARVYIHVVHEGLVDFYIPNGISPNGDGLNDTFYIPDFSTYSGIGVQIFDTWGQLVYEHNDYPNNWDGKANAGTQKGKIVNPGTYYYVFTIDGIKNPLTGYVYVAK